MTATKHKSSFFIFFFKLETRNDLKYFHPIVAYSIHIKAHIWNMFIIIIARSWVESGTDEQVAILMKHFCHLKDTALKSRHKNMNFTSIEVMFTSTKETKTYFTTFTSMMVPAVTAECHSLPSVIMPCHFALFKYCLYHMSINKLSRPQLWKCHCDKFWEIYSFLSYVLRHIVFTATVDSA